MRKVILSSIVIVLVFTAVFAGLLYRNSQTPVLAYSATLPKDIHTRAYSLYVPYRVEDGNHLEYRFYVPSQSPPLTLVMGAMRPYSITLNGKLVGSYSTDSPYRRVHALDLGVLPEGEFILQIYTPSGQLFPKALLSSTQNAKAAVHNAMMTNLISIGMHLMMILICLTLYLYKPSEKYLLMQLIISTISLATALMTADIVQMPFTDGFYVKIQHIVDGLSTPAQVFMCLLITEDVLTRGKRALRYHPWLLLLGVCTLFTALYMLRLFPLVELGALMMFGYGAISIVRAHARGKASMPILMLCFAARFALRFYNQAANLGQIPNSATLVYLYTPHLGNIILLLGCMVMSNQRFAGKFSEAERLVKGLEVANATLDQKVAERTQALEQEQNQKQRMMINIFHDLRSPLFSARGCAEMLQPQSSEQGELLGIIRDKLEFLSQLTEDLFMISKLEGGKITFVFEQLDIARLCDAICEAASIRAQTLGVQFSSEITQGLLVSGDGFRLKQALENLVDNALKFTPSGGQISLRAYQSENCVSIAIEDTGKGIRPDDLAHVFERYYHGQREASGLSTGLGLSIANEIVRAHSGHIDVASTLGNGSCFTVCLPAYLQDEPLV